jgi:uncharacterized protein YecE (DUF72 family)
MPIKIGTCGWSYLNARNYFGDWKEKFVSKLQAYAKLFDLVEINSTFYRIPKISTVEKWRKEVDAINPDFEFTIKCSQLITHKDPFGKNAEFVFGRMLEIAKKLRAKVLLLQSPSSFKPTEENLQKAGKFFNKIKRNDFILVWEVRWAENWTEDIVKRLFGKFCINQCVDPLRQEVFHAENVIYWRLHGFGHPMYNYDFSDEELKKIAEKVSREKKPHYVLFNNAGCYADALKFKKMIKV